VVNPRVLLFVDYFYSRSKLQINMSLNLNRSVFGDPANAGNVLTRDQADELLSDWVNNERLRLHMRQVAHLMKTWAAEKEGLGEADQWRWEIAGLLHDADWDQWPELHCKKIIEELEARNIDPEIIRAIASHGPNHFGVVPETRMDKMLYAFDELSGLTHAYSLMRPEGYTGMELKGIKKRFKEKAFAAAVNREEIMEAMQLAGLELETVMQFIIEKQGAVK
jgi:predicted hydrolase (HD superfamily)